MGTVAITSSVGFCLFCSSPAACLNQQCHHGIVPAPTEPGHRLDALTWEGYWNAPRAAFCTLTEMQVCAQQAGEKGALLWALAHFFLLPSSWMGQSLVTH